MAMLVYTQPVLTEIKHAFAAPFKIIGFVNFAEYVLVSHWLTLEGPNLYSGSVTLGLYFIWVFFSFHCVEEAGGVHPTLSLTWLFSSLMYSCTFKPLIAPPSEQNRLVRSSEHEFITQVEFQSFVQCCSLAQPSCQGGKTEES